MQNEVDIDILQKFIIENYKSKLQFSKDLGISYSHLNGILNKKIKLGNKTKIKLTKLLLEKNQDIEDFLIPLDMVIGNQKVKLITVSLNDELLCSISSRDIIEKENIKVDFIV